MNPPVPARDVIAEAFDQMPGGELRGYDVADRLLWALTDAGYEIVAAIGPDDPYDGEEPW